MALTPEQIKAGLKTLKPTQITEEKSPVIMPSTTTPTTNIMPKVTQVQPLSPKQNIMSPSLEVQSGIQPEKDYKALATPEEKSKVIRMLQAGIPEATVRAGFRQAIDRRLTQENTARGQEPKNYVDQNNMPIYDGDISLKGGVKGVQGQLNKGERNDQLIPQAKPFFSYNEGDIAKGGTTGIKNLGKMIGNAPTSIYNVGANVGNMILNPIDTAEGLASLVGGVSTKGIKGLVNTLGGDGNKIQSFIDEKAQEPGVLGYVFNTLSKGDDNASMLADALVDRYGSIDKLTKTVVEDPAGFVSDVSTIVGGASSLASKGAKVAGKTQLASNLQKVSTAMDVIDPYTQLPKAVKNVVKATVKPIAQGIVNVGVSALGKMTGTSADTIKQVYRSAVEGSDEARAGLRGTIDDTNVLESTRKGVEAIKDDRKLMYGKDYETLKNNTTPIGIRDIGMDTLKGMYDDLGVTFDKNGKLNFTQSKITSSSAQNNLQSIINDMKNWKDTTPAGLDILKQRVQDYYRGTPEFAKSDRFSTIVSNKIKDAIVEKVPQYAEMTRKYSEMTSLLKDIQSAVSVGGKAGTSTIVTKLKSVLRDNQEFRKAMVQKLEEYSGKDIMGQIAGLQMQPILPKGLAGVALGVGGGGGYLAGAITNPLTLLGLLGTSPRLVGEFANAVGVSVNMVNKILEKAKTFTSKGNDGGSNSNNILSKLNPTPDGNNNMKGSITPIIPTVPPKKPVVPKKTITETGRATHNPYAPKIEPVKAPVPVPPKPNNTLVDLQRSTLHTEVTKPLSKAEARTGNFETQFGKIEDIVFDRGREKLVIDGKQYLPSEVKIFERKPVADFDNILKEKVPVKTKEEGYISEIAKQEGQKASMLKQVSDDMVDTAKLSPSELSEYNDLLARAIQGRGENGATALEKLYNKYGKDVYGKTKTIVPVKQKVTQSTIAPKTVNVWIKSKFSDKGAYKDIPVIEKVDNITLYQGGSDGKRQFWTKDKKYAQQFGDVQEKTGSFYKVDNGNRVIDVYVEAPTPKKTRTLGQGATQQTKRPLSSNINENGTNPINNPSSNSLGDNTPTTVKKKPVQSDTLVSKTDGMSNKRYIDKIERTEKTKLPISESEMKRNNLTPIRNLKGENTGWYENKSLNQGDSNRTIYSKEGDIITFKKNDSYKIGYAIDNQINSNYTVPKGDIITTDLYKNKPSIGDKLDSLKANKELQPLYDEARKYKSAEEMIKNNIYYRGETGGGGNYYSTDFDFARDFTPSGLESEVKKAHIIPDDILIEKELPSANNEKEISSIINKAKKLGKRAIMVSEGKGQPNSIFVFDKSSIKTESQLRKIREEANKELQPLYEEAKKYKSADEVAEKFTPRTYNGKGEVSMDEKLKAIKNISERREGRELPLDKLSFDIQGLGFIDKKTSISNIKGIMEDIAKGKSVDPIIINKNGEVIDGNHRMIAQYIAGIKNIDTISPLGVDINKFDNLATRTKGLEKNFDMFNGEELRKIREEANKELQPLYEEAKKYQTADEFIDNAVKNTDETKGKFLTDDFIGAENKEFSSSMRTEGAKETSKKFKNNEPVEITINQYGEINHGDGHHRAYNGFILGEKIPVKIVKSRLKGEELKKYILLRNAGYKKIRNSTYPGSFSDALESKFKEYSTQLRKIREEAQRQ